MTNKKNPTSILQGINRLLTEAIVKTTDLVENVHRRIVHSPVLPSTPIQDLITTIAGFTYNNVRRGATLVGSGIDLALGQLADKIGSVKSSEQREFMRSILNGVIGDYLAAQNNPLQISMHFRQQHQVIPLTKTGLKNTFPNNSGKILLLIHGSCMTDWQWTRLEHNHGEALGKALDYTPVYLNYNSGLHISTNGQELAKQLEQLVDNWSVPVTELTILAHSMGGLVARSAVYYGQQQQRSWVASLQKMLFLGTPHHGAPLEKMGNYLDSLLAATYYTKPFAQLAKIRSAGVTDLRYGNITDDAWQQYDQFKRNGDHRPAISLPTDVECFSIAAMVGTTADTKIARLRGDNLVSLSSALGQHEQTERTLQFAETHTWIAFEHNHLDLLSSPQVYEQLRQWMNE